MKWIGLKIFAEKRRCRILIDDREIGEWFLQEPFHHRCHVTIRKVEDE